MILMILSVFDDPYDCLEWIKKLMGTIRLDLLYPKACRSLPALVNFFYLMWTCKI